MAERKAKSKEEEARDASDAQQREAERQRVAADARGRGWGGLVGATGVLVIGKARMAHARKLAGLPLDKADLDAIAMYPEMPPLVDEEK